MFEEQKTTTSLFLIRSLQDLSQEMRPKKKFSNVFHTTKIYSQTLYLALQCNHMEHRSMKL